MGTYDTRGGTPASPDMGCPPCAVCGGDPETDGCECPECPVCELVGEPDCYRRNHLYDVRYQLGALHASQEAAASLDAMLDEFEGDDLVDRLRELRDALLVSSG